MRAAGAVLASVLAGVLLLGLGACGSDDALGSSTEVPVVATEPSSTPTTPATPTAPVTEPEPLDLGDAALLPLTGAEICTALTVEAATLAIGTEVAVAEPADTSTPQCTYTYGGDSATLSTLTVAAQRPDDVGGRSLAAAFDNVVALNRGLADGTGLEEADVAAGDRAVRLTGADLTLTVVAAGGHLLTIITTPDLDTAAVEALAVAAATALG